MTVPIVQRSRPWIRTPLTPRGKGTRRLRALEAVFGQASTRRLADLGVGAGWRCLEVGCGAGGVALWLAGRVGTTGRVLATDLDARFMTGREQPNLDVQKHDITTDAIEPGSFDLAHTRNVLAHPHDRRPSGPEAGS
jgi:SAM-dependent methyltransferase